jgi:preprotein translocase subunit SecG
MKKISIIIATLFLFTVFSFASSYQAKQDAKAKTEKKPAKKQEKKEVKKVPARKTVTNKPAVSNSTIKQ